MEFDELRRKQRRVLVAEIEEIKSSYRGKVTLWSTRYPQVEARLWQHYEQYCGDLDARLTDFDEGRRSDPEKTAEVEKRYAWEFLAIIGSVEPGLPTATIHDEICTGIDRAVAAAKAQIRAHDDATSQTKAAMGDVAIDYRLARPKDETPK